MILQFIVKVIWHKSKRFPIYKKILDHIGQALNFQCTVEDVVCESGLCESVCKQVAVSEKRLSDIWSSRTVISGSLQLG